MTREELVDLIYDNFYDEREKCIDISRLDFTKYNCDVNIGGIIAPKDLFSEVHIVGGDLHQGLSEVGGSIHQDFLTAGKDIRQSYHEVGGDLEQSEQRVKGDLEQGGNDVGGDLGQAGQIVGGELYNYAPSDTDEVDETYGCDGYVVIKQNDYEEEE